MAKLNSIKKILKQRDFTQAMIIHTFGPDKIDAKRVELCTNCHWRIDLETGPPFCEHNLFPLTLTGDNCLYFDPQPPQPNQPSPKLQNQTKGD